MRIHVGSTNKAKIRAVEECLKKYSEYSNSTVFGKEVSSGVKSQPIGLDEIITGAKNRAKAAHTDNIDLAFGIESGIFPVPHTKTDYMDTTACVIYDGKQFHIGLSSSFEYPQKIVSSILNHSKEVADIAVDLGLAKDRGFRENMGIIGILTQGVITRETFTEQAVHMAMLHLLNKDLYKG